MTAELPVSASPRLRDRLAALPDATPTVLHRGDHAIYLDVEGAGCIGVLGARAALVPCGLRLAGPTVAPLRGDHVTLRDGVLRVDGTALPVRRVVDVAVPRLTDGRPGRAHHPGPAGRARDRAPAPAPAAGAARRARQRPHAPRRRRALRLARGAPRCRRRDPRRRRAGPGAPAAHDTALRDAAGVRAAGRGAARVRGVRLPPSARPARRPRPPPSPRSGTPRASGCWPAPSPRGSTSPPPEGRPHDHADEPRPRRGAPGRLRRLGGPAPGEPRRVQGVPGVVAAQVAMATPLNLEVLAEMGFAVPADATPQRHGRRPPDGRRRPRHGGRWRPRTPSRRR